MATRIPKLALLINSLQKMCWKYHTTLLENKIKVIERHQIGNDIIIDGTQKNKTDNCKHLIQQVCKELDLTINIALINYCHRIGFNHNNTQPWRIVVNVINHQGKVNMLKTRHLKINLSTKYIGIRPDMPIHIGDNWTLKDDKQFKKLQISEN